MWSRQSKIVGAVRYLLPSQTNARVPYNYVALARVTRMGIYSPRDPSNAWHFSFGSVLFFCAVQRRERS